jgi:hypothetical protein
MDSSLYKRYDCHFAPSAFDFASLSFAALPVAAKADIANNYDHSSARRGFLPSDYLTHLILGQCVALFVASTGLGVLVFVRP